MYDFVVLHAPEDADRAAALARSIKGGIVLTLPLEQGSGALNLGPQIVRVALISTAAAPYAGQIADVCRTSPTIMVRCDRVATPAVLDNIAHAVLDAAGDVSRLGQDVAEAARVAARPGAPRVRVSGVAGAAAHRGPRIGVSSYTPSQRPVAGRAPASRQAQPAKASTSSVGGRPGLTQASSLRRRGAPVAGIASAAGIGATALGLATAAVYASQVSDASLRIASAAVATNAYAAQPASMVQEQRAAVHAALDHVTSAKVMEAIVLPPSPDEIAMRVDARMEAHKVTVDQQIARLEKLEGLIAVTAKPKPLLKAKPISAAGMDIPAIEIIELAAFEEPIGPLPTIDIATVKPISPLPAV